MSLSLPPSLRPWADQLKELVPELALSLGPLIERLSSALGPLQERYEPGRDSPEGFSGLARRGPYDRLLVSEWALLDVVPDEFVRRSATSEHLFLELERRTPRDGKRCLALFDAGPDQLGSPRLAHLALLVVLDRRAWLAGAELHWQILQAPAPPRVSAGRSELMALLLGRSIEDPSPVALERCLEVAGLQPADELWVIGGPRAISIAPARAGRLLLTEPWEREQDKDKLLAIFSGPGRSRQEVSLPLPEPRHRTQLLRNPLVAPTTEAIVPPLPSQGRGLLRPLRPLLVFSAEGSRLLSQERTGALVAWSIPRMERRPARMEVAADETVLALGWSHQRIGCVRQKGSRTVLETPADHVSLSESEPQPKLTTEPSLLYLFSDTQRGCHVAHFVDGDGQLWEWPTRPHPPQVRRGVLGIFRYDGQLLVVEPRQMHEPTLPLADRVWFGPNRLQALRLTDGSWYIPNHGRIRDLANQVMGVTFCGRPERHPALLVSDGPGLALRLVRVDGTDVLIAKSARVAASSGGPQPMIAWLDEEEGLFLYDPITHRLVARRPFAEEE